MKITKRQLRRIIRETDDKAKRVGGGQSWGEEDTDTLDEDDESTIKYNANPALKGDQTKLPDSLQKGIIDSEEDEDKNESIMRITKRQLRKMIRESLEEETDLYVVIANAGRGRQSMWPKSERPGVYSKAEAEAIAKEQNSSSRSMGFGGSIHYHAQPLSRDLLGGRFGVSPGNEAYIGLTKLLDDYDSGGLLSDEESYERGFHESRARLTKRQIKSIVRKTLREGGGIAMSPSELVAAGESVWTPDMSGYHPLIDGDSTSNGITKQALHGGWAVEEYQAEIEDIMTNNLDNPHMELAYNIVFKDAAPGYLPFNFFNKLREEFESLGASEDLKGHFFHVMVSDDFEINPPGW